MIPKDAGGGSAVVFGRALLLGLPQHSAHRVISNGLAGAPSPFRYCHISFGDSYAQNYGVMGSKIAPVREYGFGVTYLYGGGARAQYSQWNYTPVGGTLHIADGNGQTIEWGTGVGVEAYRVRVYYVRENGAGSFVVEANTAGAGWVAVPGGGVKQVETFVGAGNITGSGNLSVTVTGAGIAGSPLALSVAVADGDTAATWVGKVRSAIAAEAAITALYTVGGASTSITLTPTSESADDPTLLIQVAAGTVANASLPISSTNTTAGSAPLNADNGGAYAVGVFSYDFPTTEVRQIRIRRMTGSVRIIGMLLSDIRSDAGASKGGTSSLLFGLGGEDTNNFSLVPQHVWDTLLQSIQPDLVTYKSDEGDFAGLATWYARVQAATTARPVDWIFVSRHPSNAVAYNGQGPYAGSNAFGALLPMDETLRNFALNNGQMFFDSRALFGNAAKMIATGMTTDGNAHLTARGDTYEQLAILNELERGLQASSQYKAAIGVEMGSLRRMQQQTVTLSSGKGFFATVETTVGAGVNHRPCHGFSKLDEFGAVGFHFGQFLTCDMVRDQYGNWFFTYDTGGFGNGIPGTLPRATSAKVEIFTGNRLTSRCLVLSAAATHSGDIFAIFSGATTAAAGTRTCGLTAAGALDVATMKVGATGTVVVGVFSAAAALDFPSIAAGAEATLTIAVAGAATANTPSVALGWSAALPDGIVVKQAWVSAAGTVSIRVANITAGAIDPGAVNCRATVTNF